MIESIDLEIGTGRDKLDGIETMEDKVIINYKSNDQTRPIVIPKRIIDFVKKTIMNMEVGERYGSVYIYNKYINEFKIKSKIIEDRLPILKKLLIEKGIEKKKIEWIMEDLESNNNFSLMNFDEMIGLRQIKSSHYFKVYGAIRYWKEMGIIEYTQRGGIYRLI